MRDEYSLIVDLVRRECTRQIKAARLPQELRQKLTDRDVLFGEHPVALVALPLITYRAVGGSHIQEVAPVGAAIEFLLAAADILDDVQDRTFPDDFMADEKIHTHYRTEIELITLLLFLGEQSITSLIGLPDGKLDNQRVSQAISVLNTFKLRAFAGQYVDAHSRVDQSTDIETSLKITSGKSGSIGRCAAKLGAILGTEDASLIDLTAQYGEHLAIARQFHDDVSNLWPTTGRLDDLEQLKRTLPLTFALANNDDDAESQRSSLQTLARLDYDLEPGAAEAPFQQVNDELMQARDEVFKNGGIHFTMLQSLIHLVKARSIAREIEKLPSGEGLLESLASV
jgi:geranylgeranyl pyrophosphate synthase